MPTAADAVPADAAPVDEAAIAVLVERFYERARKDALLGPVFEAAIHDWDDHLARIRDFWIHHLLGGPSNARGHMFMAHAVLPVGPAHFDRWLALFAETSAELLPPDLHRKAMKRANHVSDSIRTGMFTVPGHRFGTPPG